MTPNERFDQDLKCDVEARVREGVKAVLEEVLQEEMTEHLEAGHRELTPTRRGERNGRYTRNLVTPAGKIERLEVPRDREGEFVTEVFERYKRMTGDVEEAVLEMYLSGISVRKIAGVTEALSRVKVGKDAVSRIARRLEEEQREWRERSLKEKAYPYLYLDATYLKVRWGTRVTSMALLACVGVDDEGFREVLAVEVAGTEKGAAYASLLRGLIDRGLSGVRLVVSDGHEGIKAAVFGELPGAEWQRCVVHFERNVLSHVPASSMGEVAQDLKAIFKVRREKTARALAEEFVELYGKRFPKAVSVFEAGMSDALTYLGYPGSHHARIRTTNMLERLFKEVKRRTKVVGVFPNETSASTLATAIALRSSEE
ncbi:MAG: IS256 family transposase, partial [Actinobacteria bacterium]|nr:IS256 family transposase [Actinomycetota bacterium]